MLVGGSHFKTSSADLGLSMIGTPANYKKYKQIRIYINRKQIKKPTLMSSEERHGEAIKS